MSLLSDINLNTTLGAAFIGFGFSSAAFGICTNQAITYFSRFPGDKPRYKWLVALVWVLCAVDQAFIGHVVYFYTITNYANPIVLLEHVVWSLIIQLTLGALIGTVVRLCFAARVWRFSQRNYIITTFIVLLTLAELGLAIYFTIKCFQFPYLAVLPKLKLAASLALGAGAVTDVVIAGSLCYFLRQYRTGSKSADSLVKTLSVYAINTGAFTAGFSIITLVFYDLHPDNFQFLAFFFVLSKVYAISFYCTLNTRTSIRGKGTDRSNERSEAAGPTRLTLSGSMAGSQNHIQSKVDPQSTKRSSGTIIYGYPKSTMETSTGGPASVFAGRSADGHAARSPSRSPFEGGVRAEVSVISDVDETGLDVKQHDDLEYGYPDSSRRYSQSQWSHKSPAYYGDDKDDLELVRRSGGSTSPTSATYALPYAYSPPTSPAYSYSLESGNGGYGWGSAGKKGVYAFGYGAGVGSASVRSQERRPGEDGS
ncbi:hypothetical protein HMN09_00555600 [Mycena chlorophos]|uniref:DUF6534 domain-containing protein n=1 Tax=Mycena chlorophos TaxID=658473 RepID=A0A8H6TAQ0_MYCCL|nr:hypothetical protein HMN09_00555600 [Mycena chlorophos]